MKGVRLRMVDGPPRLAEIMIPLLIWSFVFKVLLPEFLMFRGVITPDGTDVLCYTAGALGAFCIWRFLYRDEYAEKSKGHESVNQ